MKRLHDLTPGDLERIVIWRYDGESDDTAVVHATDLNELSADDKGPFIARTQFVLANGSQFAGFCSPCEDENLDSLQPVIATPSGLVYFVFDTPPTRESLAAQWRRLDAGYELVFPVHFRCSVPFNGQYITGVIEAGDVTGAA